MTDPIVVCSVDDTPGIVQIFNYGPFKSLEIAARWTTNEHCVNGICDNGLYVFGHKLSFLYPIEHGKSSREWDKENG